MPDLTPRLAIENDWSVYGFCEHCRMSRSLPIRELFEKTPDRDLGEALMRGKITCSKPSCGRTCSAINVSKMQVGIVKRVMELTPGLTVKRETEE